MSRTELNHKVKELRELRRIAEEIATEIETITDTIKREMTAQGVDMIAGDDWKATWKPVQSDLKARHLRSRFPTFTGSSPARPKSAVLCWHEKGPFLLPERKGPCSNIHQHSKNE